MVTVFSGNEKYFPHKTNVDTCESSKKNIYYTDIWLLTYGMEQVPGNGQLIKRIIAVIYNMGESLHVSSFYTISCHVSIQQKQPP